ncbi:hypothetical protein BDV93DRAFT_545411 [Ceratobasidium sp. AG-I]|nr:hypothetical protein BDV93DRAFT_545411 [Ceratobasidium sp. AG-I]
MYLTGEPALPLKCRTPLSDLVFSPLLLTELTMAPVERALSGAYINTPNLLLAQLSLGQPRGFMQLPIELVLLVAQQISTSGRFSDLSAFARLLKLDWRYTRALQEVLFNRIHVDTYERYSKLARTLQSGVAPQRDYQLAPMVRHISATFGTHPAPGQQPFLEEHLLNLYEQCPQLTSISLVGTHGWIPHQLPTVGDLYPIEQLDTIQSLTLVCPLEPLSLLLLRRLPNLTELCIVGGKVRFQLGDRPPLSGPGLRRITWGASTPSDALSIQWLFAHSDEVTGGDITLLTRPHMNIQLEQIRDYASMRGMNFSSPPELRSVEGAT